MKLKKLFGTVVALAAAMILFGSCIITVGTTKYALTFGNNIRYENGLSYNISDIQVLQYPSGNTVKEYSGTLRSGEKKTFYLQPDYYYFYFYDRETRRTYYTDYIYLDRDIIFLAYNGMFYEGTSWSVRAATGENKPAIELTDKDGNTVKVLELHEVEEPSAE